MIRSSFIIKRGAWFAENNVKNNFLSSPFPQNTRKGRVIVPRPGPTPKRLKAIFGYINMRNGGMLMDRRPVTEKKVQNNVFKTHHNGRIHNRHMSANNQETEQEMDKVKPESRRQVKLYLSLLRRK